MKANLKGANGIELNCDYLKTVGSVYTYFYIPASALSAELLNSICPDGPISSVDKYNDDTWMVQVKSNLIKWEE